MHWWYISTPLSSCIIPPPPPLPRRTRINNLCCHVACTTADSLKVSGTSWTAREMAGGPANLTRHLTRLHNMDPDATNEHKEQLQHESCGTPFRQGDTGIQQVSRGLRPERAIVYREPSAILQPRTPVVGNPPPPRAGLVHPGPPLCMVGIPRATVPRPIVRGAHASSGRWPFKTQLSNGARGHPVSPMDSARNDLGMCEAQHLDTAYGFIPAGGYYRGDATGHPTVAPAARLRQDMLQSREQYTGYDYLPRDGNNRHDPAVIGDFPLAPAAHLRQGMVQPLEQHTGYGHITRGVNYRGLPTVTGRPHVAPAAHLRQDMVQHREQYTGYGNHPRDVNNQYTGYGHVTRSVNYRGLPTITTPRPTVPMGFHHDSGLHAQQKHTHNGNPPPRLANAGVSSPAAASPSGASTRPRLQRPRC
jgi:hypothetical protein